MAIFIYNYALLLELETQYLLIIYLNYLNENELY